MSQLEPTPEKKLDDGEASTHGAAVQSDAAEAARPAGPPNYDESIVEMLAAKILIDWLRNRQQLLVPFKLDLQKLEMQQVDTLMQAMIAAAQAEGTVTDRENPRFKLAMHAFNANAAHHDAFERALTHPLPMRQVLAQVPDVQAGALVYAASVLAIDRRKLVNRQYLRYLAARLQLPRELARALEQRHAAAS